MGLKDIQLPSDTVEISDGQLLTVRGISFVDLKALFRKHSEQMVGVFDMLAQTQNTRELDVVNAAAVIANVIQIAPALAADVICVGAGEPDDPTAFAIALSLPFPVQIDAIKKIGTLTFSTEQSAKNFLRTVGNLLVEPQDSQKG